MVAAAMANMSRHHQLCGCPKHAQENALITLQVQGSLPRPFLGGGVLTFIPAIGGGTTSVEMRYEDENL
jgi:hypothetical protein